VTRCAGDDDRIVLVDGAGRAIGVAGKTASHHADTPLHLAFSCYVFDDDGAFLATRRADCKRVWPGVWSNSVCGHPGPGEDLVTAVLRRLDEELGMTAVDVEVVLPHYVYRAPPFLGIVEHEFCPVFVAHGRRDPRPNPLEVADFRWMSWPDFVRVAEEDRGDACSWWCRNQLRQLERHPTVAAYARSPRS
jgi:isopentenyl-diphosphate Delta-isomerase